MNDPTMEILVVMEEPLCCPSDQIVSSGLSCVREEEAFDTKYNLLREVSICSGALMDIFGFGKDRWILASKAAD